MDNKAIDLSLTELRDLHSFMGEVSQSLVDIEDVIGSIKRVGEEGRNAAAKSSLSSLLEFEHEDGDTGSTLLSAGVEFKLLQKLQYKAESLHNVLRDTRQRLKDRYFGLRQLIQRNEGMLEKFGGSCGESGFDTIKEKDVMAIERYLVVQKDAVAMLLKCEEVLKK